MAYYITDDCILCNGCKNACPISCIELGDKIYVIDEDKCVECGKCEAVCPMGAIFKK